MSLKSVRFYRVTMLLAVAAQLASAAAHAEPVVDRALSGVRQISKPACTILKIDFNFRIRYDSHFPLDHGAELRISVKPIDPAQAAALSLLKREALRAPDANSAAIQAIDFEANEPGGPVLRIRFDHPVTYKVAPGGDFESVIVAISGKQAGKGPAADCKPEVERRANDPWATAVTREAGAGTPGVLPALHVPPPGEATTAQAAQAAGWMDEARAAIKKGDYMSATRVLGKVLSLPSNPSTADAQEFMGVARQKAGDLAAARAEYEEFLRRTPHGEAAERVRQRLAGVMTAQGDGTGKLRSAKSSGSAADGSTWTVSGSASQFYIRDDSFRALRDPSLPPELNAAKDDHLVHRNTLLSSFDTIAAWNTPEMKSKFRFSGTEEHNFTGKDEDIISVAALSLETTFRQLDLMTRLGRQTRNTGGVLGRFDGGLASWQANPFMRINTVVGSPVERRKDTPFKDDKLFYGVSADFGPFAGGIETSLFAIEQRDRSFLDRQAVGAEMRYLQPDKSLFATLDYDVHFGELNAALVSGSWTFADKSTVFASADYRKAPYLSAWTALQGQPFTTLYDLLKVKTKEEIDQLAIDRTSSYRSAMLGFSYPLNDKLQLTVDGTVSDVSGTVASGGVDATLAPGVDYYASSQLIGTNVFNEGDMYIGALRYAHRPDSNLYVADVSARFPVTNEFKVSPRLRVGYRVGDGTDLSEISVLPSVLFNYYWTRDLNFEVEVGANWTQLDQLNTRETTTDVFLTAGFRYDFYADGRTACAKGVIGCP